MGINIFLFSTEKFRRLRNRERRLDGVWDSFSLDQKEKKRVLEKGPCGPKVLARYVSESSSIKAEKEH